MSSQRSGTVVSARNIPQQHTLGTVCATFVQTSDRPLFRRQDTGFCPETPGETLKAKLLEPLILNGEDAWNELDIRLRVHGGGHVSQIYAVRQAISKAVVAFYQKYVDERAKAEVKNKLIEYDRTLLVADPRRMEPKKSGGQGAKVRRQMSYR